MRLTRNVDAGLSRRQVLTNLTAASVSALVLPDLGALAPSQEPKIPSAPTQSIPNTIDADASSRFRNLADRLMVAMDQHKVPGAALGVLFDGKEEHGIFGVTDVKTKNAVTGDTLFAAGSLTKVYTGTAIMRLVDQGKLDLDATVRTYLPDFKLKDPGVASRVTIRHLLTHTMGCWAEDISETTGSGDDALARYVAEVVPTFGQVFPLGEFFSYNNICFSLMGRLIEVATGKTYRTAIRELLLDPLGMKSSTFEPKEILRGSHALGHFEGPKGTEIATPTFLPRVTDPPGGLWTTTREQMKWARFHLGGGGPLLSRHSLELMRTPQVAVPGIPSLHMGMDWFVQDIAGTQLVFHNGDTFGLHTVFVLAPSRGFALVLLTNSLGGSATELPVLNQALQEYLGLGLEASRGGLNPASTLPTGTQTVSVPPDRLAQYAGRYSTPDMTYLLRVENGRLLLTIVVGSPPDQVKTNLPEPAVKDYPLTFVAEDLALLGSGLVSFVRKPQGEVGWFASGLRLTPKIGSV